jgi:DNA replication licensing factor MCM2
VVFNRFISNFRDSKSGRLVYTDAFVDMCAQNQQSLVVRLEDLALFQPTIAWWVGHYPGLVLPKLHEALFARACRHFRSYGAVNKEAFVRFKESSMTDDLRKLMHRDIGKLVYIRGVVTYRSSIMSQMREVYFRCRQPQCGHLKGPFLITDVSDFHHGKCLLCQSNSFRLESSKVLYRNYQTYLVQEKPQNVEPGRVPRHKEVVVAGDLADRVKPGDEVELVGVYACRYSFSLTASINYPVMYTFIECNNIYPAYEIKELTPTTFRDLQELGRRPDIVDLLARSAFPSIFGHKSTKLALLLSLFGGVEVDSPDHRIRGDINVIMVGDPGTAKSQMLKSVQAVSPKAVYTTGKGASAVGLTATVRMNYATQEWGIEAGALVLSDKGVCIIDEFDKMTEYDRSAIHEAMEQQSISIAKAGLVTRLNARCSVVAAANPVKGRYDRSVTFRDNVDLSEPILSRFDMLCVILDEIDPVVDG